MSSDHPNETLKGDKVPRGRRVQFSTSIGDDDNFNITKVALTPSVHKINPEYRVPEERSAQSVAPESSISKPNYEGKLN